MGLLPAEIRRAAEIPGIEIRKESIGGHTEKPEKRRDDRKRGGLLPAGQTAGKGEKENEYSDK